MSFIKNFILECQHNKPTEIKRLISAIKRGGVLPAELASILTAININNYEDVFFKHLLSNDNKIRVPEKSIEFSLIGEIDMDQVFEAQKTLAKYSIKSFICISRQLKSRKKICGDLPNISELNLEKYDYFIFKDREFTHEMRYILDVLDDLPFINIYDLAVNSVTNTKRIIISTSKKILKLTKDPVILLDSIDKKDLSLYCVIRSLQILNMYSENIFTKIINGEIPSQKVYEDEFVLAFKDINPASSMHILLVPKNKYTDYTDFMSNATELEILHYFKILNKLTSSLETYRIISNKGTKSGQSVFHFHTHIISGAIFKNLI